MSLHTEGSQDGFTTIGAQSTLSKNEPLDGLRSSGSFEFVEPMSTTETSFSSIQPESRPSEPEEHGWELAEKSRKALRTGPEDLSKDVKDLNLSGDDIRSKDKRARGRIESAIIPTLEGEHGRRSSSSSVNSDLSQRPPPSSDEKSVTSGANFAFDERESIRPDDSASIKAVDDEDQSAPSSKFGSEAGARAFRDQLQKISERPRLHPHGQLIAQRTQSPLHPPVPTMAKTSFPIGPEVILDGAQENGLRPSQGVSLGIAHQGPDEKLLEALDNPKDRLFLLRVEQDVIEFVKDSKDSYLNLPPCNSFCRLLIHKLADYYLLTHFNDAISNSIRLYRTPYCRLPPPLTTISNPPTSENTPPPNARTMKIMRREASERSSDRAAVAGSVSSRSEPPSKPSSEGEAVSRDEPETTPQQHFEDTLTSKEKSSLTREQREAKYKEARERIFKDFSEDQGQSAEAGAGEKGKNVSRSSSTVGKAKMSSRKNRNLSDDGFEARSRFAPYHPGSDPHLQNAPGGAPQMVFSAGQPGLGNGTENYSPISNDENVGQYYLPGQQPPYGANPGHFFPGQYPSPGPYLQTQNLEYGSPNRAVTGMQPPVASDPFNAMGTPSRHPMQPQMGVNMQQPPPYHNQPASPYAGNYAQTSPYSGPFHGQNGSPIMPQHSPYAFAQLPNVGLAQGRSPRNFQHPPPGNYHGNPFNPQTRSFIPNIDPLANNTMGAMPPPFPAYGSQKPFAPGMMHFAPNGPMRQTSPFHSNREQGSRSNDSGVNRGADITPPSKSTLPKWNSPANLPPKPPASQQSAGYAAALKASLPNNPTQHRQPSMPPAEASNKSSIAAAGPSTKSNC